MISKHFFPEQQHFKQSKLPFGASESPEKSSNYDGEGVKSPHKHVRHVAAPVI
jgi:hypothetical protein